MSYSPAAVLTIFFISNDILDSRLTSFYKKLGAWTGKDIEINKKSISTELSSSWNEWDLIIDDKISQLNIYLWINHKNGLNNNICLEECRYFLFNLVNEGVIDVAFICFGLPKEKSWWRIRKYNRGEYIGREYPVTLKILQSRKHSRITHLVNPINNFIADYWTKIINKDDEVISVELRIKNINLFMKNASRLPLFVKSGIADFF